MNASTEFNFDEEYEVVQEIVAKCNFAQLKTCESFVRGKIESIREKRRLDYLAGLEEFDLEDKQIIIETMTKLSATPSATPSGKPSGKPKNSDESGTKKPCGFVEFQTNNAEYWVPQLVHPDEDDFFAAGSPNNKKWVGKYKDKEDKEERQAKYGAAIVLQQHPEKLKMLAKKGAVYKKDGDKFVVVPVAELG